LFSNDALVLIQADRLTVLVIFAASTREAACVEPEKAKTTAPRIKVELHAKGRMHVRPAR
jgi:hypothetical protein